MTHRIATVLLFVGALTAPAAGQPAATTTAAAPPAAQPAPMSSAPPADRHPEQGRPSIRNYEPREFGLTTQNWAIAQDARGVIYVGTNAGVAEYDGVSWRLIELGGGQLGRSLDVDRNGTVWVGGVGVFGLLAPDATGQLAFRSLADKVPADARGFTDVWRTFATDSGVYFVANAGIYRWANDALTVIKPSSRINRASLVGGRLYVPVPESGLNVLDGSTLRPLPDTQALGREVTLVVLPFDERRLLIGTRDQGLFLHDGTSLAPFPTAADQILKTTSLYRGAVLPDGTFALATLSAGWLAVDRHGSLRLALDTASGLAANATTFILPDREGGVWTAMQGGLARIAYPSAESSFRSTEGYPGAYFLRRHDGRLYGGTSNGAWYLEPAAAGRPARFGLIPGLGRQCWALEEMPDPSGRTATALALACHDGLFEVRGTVAIPVRAPRDGTYAAAGLLRSRVDPTRVWVALNDGVASFRRENGRWIDEDRLPGASGNVRSLAESPDGTLWAGLQEGGVWRVTFASRPRPGAPRPSGRARLYDAAHGLLPDGAYVFQVGDDFLVRSGARQLRVSRFDPATDRFVTDEVLSALPFDRFSDGFGFFEAPDGTLLASFGRGVQAVRRDAQRGWIVDGDRFATIGPVGVAAAWVEPADRIAWFDTGQRLVRFDLGQQMATGRQGFQVLVRRVTAGHDRVLYGGAGPVPAGRLPASSGPLRFEYAAATFVDENTTLYQTRLEGLETDWGEWTRETRREFTMLPPGSYRFRVRARNVTGQVEESVTYAFELLPPWYRTWWSYGGYVLLLGIAVSGSARLMRHRVVSKERERSQFAEARLRAEAAEQLAATESEGRKQVELLSEIGREITASLDIDTIFGRLYERLNRLADADVFGVGLYYPERHEIEYRLAIEDGKRYAPYMRDTTNRDQLPVWCIEQRRPVFINDLAAEFSRYVPRYDGQSRQLEDGSMSRTPKSLIYVPLVSKDRVLGVITIQSFEKDAYDGHHLNVLQSLASYTAVALDNAGAYRQLNEQEHEIRRLFEAAERARDVAEEADAAKSAFLSTVSHELRTPLTSVLGFAKIIKKRLEDRIFPLVPRDDRRVVQTVQQIDDNLKVVVSEGERLTKLIDDVLDLAKIEAGKLEWHMGEVSIAEVIEHATAATSSLFEHKGLRLAKEVAPDLPAVTGDRDRLVQVVINLISNAVKFTDAGAVTCRAVRQGSEIVVSIVDTGVGIVPADQPKVFERFKQVGDTLTDKPKGTGLGLPICKEIVEHHGGRVWVESALGEGSTFAFSLPLSGAAADAAPGSPLELAALIRQLRDQVVVTTPRTADRQPRILVVDDEANIRELLTQEFTEAGYVVTTAANGREAVAKVRAERPDLIVLDVMMPEMNGFDVAAVLKNDPATLDIPIVILSIVQDRDRGYRVGVDRYLTKPIDTDLLFREVGALIEQKKSHRRVLVVDEDASTVKSLTDVLSARGYSVVEASGEQAVERAVAVQPDIILLNAVSSGAQAVRTLRFEKGLEHVLFLVYQ